LDLEDPATTRALLELDAIVGVAAAHSGEERVVHRRTST
jgi:hypothetical protein